MTQGPTEVHALFKAEFLAEARAELVRSALTACSAARDLVRHAGFPPDQARDVLPHVRRADFEARIASLLLPGVSVAVRQNDHGTSSFVELTTPGVSVTALTRSRSPGRLPKACYRSTRAESSQTSLFSLLGEAESRETGDRLYGVFVYGGRSSELALARVYFPIPNAKLLAVPPLDLLAEYWSGSQRTTAEVVRPTEEAANIVMSLKRKLQEGDGQ